jgi:uncharacterized membrane protein
MTNGKCARNSPQDQWKEGGFVRSGPAGRSSDVNLWRIPLGFSLASLAFFGLTMIPDVLDARGVIHLPDWFTMGGIDDARAILSAMLGSVSTVLALIFSVALLVLSMVATLFGPRLLYRFLQDWVTQATIGLFMATFIYLCLVFLVTHEDSNSTFIPEVSLITSWFLVIASFAFLIYYSHRIAASIQNPDMIARIVDDLRPTVIEVHAGGLGRGSGADLSSEVIARQIAEGDCVKCKHSGYVQEIDRAALVAAALQADAVIHLIYRPGQFVLWGEPLACVWPPQRLTDVETLIERHVRIGRHRILKQDCEFGIAQIVEIAIRALSPAVNDTFTGVGCVDWLTDALLIISDASLGNGCWYDDGGKMRLHVPPLRLERVVKTAFDLIRQAVSDNPAVLIRILDAVRRMTPRVRTEGARQALMAQVDAIREAASTQVLVKLDRDDVEAAWRKIRAVAETAAVSG